ncbi:hypothetical protein P3T27_005966 [Kitasatospora sp. MAA19]|uniref:hypothetical protein n=1 Tax=unclassified Kitasatospora TaxID=2633591 RepID=UPI002472E960|nr:hypothetical protein [Kitasatospora sp. MAA19]MDH6709220.1 hypothetical protein [Kitasatospora sp. MAA19]
MIRIANLNAYKLHPRDVGTEGWSARVTAIREVSPDILCLQEVLVDDDAPEDTDADGIVDETKRLRRWDSQATTVIERLARECGLTATIVRSDGSAGAVAMARNAHRPWYTAVLWRPETVTPVPGGFRAYGSPGLFVAAVTVSHVRRVALNGCAGAARVTTVRVGKCPISMRRRPFRSDGTHRPSGKVGSC